MAKSIVLKNMIRRSDEAMKATSGGSAAAIGSGVFMRILNQPENKHEADAYRRNVFEADDHG